MREDRGEHPVTISTGLAHIDEGDTIGMALGKADQALYTAKRTGKDRFVLWSGMTVAPAHSRWARMGRHPA